MARLSESEVRSIVDAERSDALAAFAASKLSDDRAKAMDYYLGDMADDMPTLPDRSKAVSTDVADTVEGLMPSLMEIFAGGDEVVSFDPVGPEDEAAAEQETDYVNHVFLQENEGFLVLYTFIKDALLQKNGVVKVYWEETERQERETFVGLHDDEFGIIVSDPDLEIIEHDEETVEQTDPMGNIVASETLHNVTVLRSLIRGRARVEPVPPEEFGIARKAKSIADAGYCFHEVYRTVSELIDAGWDEEQVRGLPQAEFDQTEEALARDTVFEREFGQGQFNQANRMVRITEHYVRMNYEDDDRAGLYRVTTAGESREILRRDGQPDIEPVDVMPFASATPIIMPHRFTGRSVADQVMDIQRIKTALLRSLLDNAYLANNARMEIAESHATKSTIDDLLQNRPGGIIRTRAPGGLVPVPTSPIGNTVFPLIEYMDGVREWRTGVTRQGQGVDPTALQNIGEKALLDQSNSARAKTKLIARIFAETGIKDLFQLLHTTIRKNEGRARTLRLRNKWVTVDPRTWRARYDMTINVGLGGGTREHQIAFLTQMLQIQREAVMRPDIGLTKPGQIYNTLKRLVEQAGLKHVEHYFSDPDAVGPDGKPVPKPPPPPDPKVVEAQAKMEMEKQKAMITLTAERERMAHRAEIERTQAEADIAVKNREAEAEAALAQQKFEFEKELKMMDYKLKCAQHDNTIVQDELTGENPVRVILDAIEASQQQSNAQIQSMITQLGAMLSQPKRVVRDPETNRVVGVEPVPVNTTVQ